jgi:hypothetical protein
MKTSSSVNINDLIQDVVNIQESYIKHENETPLHLRMRICNDTTFDWHSKYTESLSKIFILKNNEYNKLVFNKCCEADNPFLLGSFGFEMFCADYRLGLDTWDPYKISNELLRTFINQLDKYIDSPDLDREDYIWFYRLKGGCEYRIKYNENNVDQLREDLENAQNAYANDINNVSKMLTYSRAARAIFILGDYNDSVFGIYKWSKNRNVRVFLTLIDSIPLDHLPSKSFVELIKEEIIRYLESEDIDINARHLLNMRLESMKNFLKTAK